MLKALDPSSAVPGRVRSALDTIAESLLVIDRHGDLVLANAAFAELDRPTGRVADRRAGRLALGWIVGESAKDRAVRAPRRGRAALDVGVATRQDMLAYVDPRACATASSSTARR